MKASIYYVILLLIVGQNLLFKNGLIRTLKFDSLLLYVVVNDHIVCISLESSNLPLFGTKQCDTWCSICALKSIILCLLYIANAPTSIYHIAAKWATSFTNMNPWRYRGASGTPETRSNFSLTLIYHWVGPIRSLVDPSLFMMISPHSIEEIVWLVPQ